MSLIVGSLAGLIVVMGLAVIVVLVFTSAWRTRAQPSMMADAGPQPNGLAQPDPNGVAPVQNQAATVNPRQNPRRNHDQGLAPANAPAQDEPSRLLQDLQMAANSFQRRDALVRLAQLRPKERRADVAKVLDGYINDPDVFTRKACFASLAVWGTEANVPSLIQVLDNQDVFTRWEAMKLLGDLKADQAAEPVAKRLIVASDRDAATNALIALGPPAQKAVAPYLSDPDWTTRLNVCKILNEIGTKDSVGALQLAMRDSNRLVARQASQALASVARRP